FQEWKPPAPEQAKNPTPANDSQNVAKMVMLSWAPVQGATSYRIFMGPGSPDQPRGEQPGTAFQPNDLQDGVRYAWRVDTVNEGGGTTGGIWTFTVKPLLPPPLPTLPPPPGQAFSPMPADQARDVPPTTQLTWQGVPDAKSYRVFLGLASPDQLKGEQ